MNDVLSSMSRTHLSVDCALDAIADLLAELRERKSVTSRDVRVLKRHSLLMVKLFSEHVTEKESVAQLATRLLGPGLSDVQELDLHTRRLLQLMRNFHEMVRTFPLEGAPTSPQWRQLRYGFERCLQAFASYTEKGWEFFATYSTLLAPQRVMAD